MNSKRLFVYAPGTLAEDDAVKRLVEDFRQLPEFGGDKWLICAPRIRRSKSNILEVAQNRPEHFALELVGQITEEWVAEGRYDEIILIGYLDGGITVRHAYLLASGVYPERPGVNPWAKHVVRIVMLGTPNRGYVFFPQVFGTLFDIIYHPFYYTRALLRGSHYLTEVKIRWIRHLSELGNAAPQIVQLVGTEGMYYERDADIDVEQFPTANHVEIAALPYEIPHYWLADDPHARFRLLSRCILGEVGSVAKPRNIPHRTDVVFVLHGIRANNSGWTEQTRRLIRAHSDDIEVVMPSYGFFSALRFPFALMRKGNIRWFQQLYAYYLARYPRARFHFIGHSYGTYILGYSLKRLPAMRFCRVTLVGSVLPAGYPWLERFDRSQVEQVFNHRASRDFPVAFLCSALRALRFGFGDVGTGGFDGFQIGDQRCKEISYYAGGHSEALAEAHLPSIIKLTLEESFEVPPLKGKVSAMRAFLSRMSILLFLISLGAVAIGIWYATQALAAYVPWPPIVIASVLIAILLFFLEIF